jgi:hypothetical protein
VAELIVLGAVVAGVVLVVWAVVGSTARRRTPHDEDEVTSTRTVPPVEPTRPVPGSRPHRRDQGAP